MLANLLTELAQVVSPAWWHQNFDELLKVFLIDITLAGDNAIVVGIAASQVRRDIRAKVIFWGIAGAVILRVLFAGITQQLLSIIGLTLAGGLLLLWVCWKMFRQISSDDNHDIDEINRKGELEIDPAKAVGFSTAVGQIMLADLSMSLDNVLAVAGAAGKSQLVLFIGLGLAILLMAIASHFIARLLGRYPWIAWLGLAVIVWVAIDMIYRGTHEVTCEAYNVGCSETLMEGIKHRLGLSRGAP